MTSAGVNPLLRHPFHSCRDDVDDDVSASAPLLQLLTLSGVFMAMTFAVFVIYGLLANAFRQAVIESPRVQAWLRRCFAAAFAGLAVDLAFPER